MVKLQIEPTKKYWIVNGEIADEQRDKQITRCLIQDIKDGNGTDKDILKLCRRADIVLPENNALISYYRKNIDIFQKLIYNPKYNKTLQQEEKDRKETFVLIPDHFKWKKVLKEISITNEEQQTLVFNVTSRNELKEGDYIDKFGKKHHIFVSIQQGKVFRRVWEHQYIKGYRYQLIPEYNAEDKELKATPWETYSFTKTIDKPIVSIKTDRNWYIHLSQDDCDFQAGIHFANGQFDTEVPLRKRINVTIPSNEHGTQISERKAHKDQLDIEIVWHEDTRVEELDGKYYIDYPEEPKFVPIAKRYKSDWDSYYNWCKENKEVIL